MVSIGLTRFYVDMTARALIEVDHTDRRIPLDELIYQDRHYYVLWDRTTHWVYQPDEFIRQPTFVRRLKVKGLADLMENELMVMFGKYAEILSAVCEILLKSGD